MALDHPAAVTRVAVLDIVPTAEVYDRANQLMGYTYRHWFFLGSLMKVARFAPAALDAYRAAGRTIQAPLSSGGPAA